MTKGVGGIGKASRTQNEVLASLNRLELTNVNSPEVC